MCAMGLYEQAARRRRIAEMERRLAELDEWDRVYGLGGTPSGPSRRRRRRRGPGLGSALVLLVVVALVGVFFFPDSSATRWGLDAGRSVVDAGRSVLGMPQSEPEVVATEDPQPEGPVRMPPVEPPDLAQEPDYEAGLGERLRDQVEDFIPQVERRWLGWRPPGGERVLPPVDPGTAGAYTFLATQPGTDEPVGFSPCGSVEVVVNPAGAPEGYTELVRASLERITAASGLHVVLAGETDEVWSDERREAGLPVLLTFADAEAVPVLGESAGMAGPSMVTGPDGRWWSASGQVVVDPGQLPTAESLSAVLDHEFAHVVGLGHVGEDGELMAPVNTGQLSFGPGDRAGLAALGAIACP